MSCAIDVGGLEDGWLGVERYDRLDLPFGGCLGSAKERHWFAPLRLLPLALHCCDCYLLPPETVFVGYYSPRLLGMSSEQFPRFREFQLALVQALVGFVIATLLRYCRWFLV